MIPSTPARSRHCGSKRETSRNAASVSITTAPTNKSASTHVGRLLRRSLATGQAYARPQDASRCLAGSPRSRHSPSDQRIPMMIEAGQQAPDFTLSDQDGEPVTLSELRGRPVVVYFYPKADTPG